MSEDQMVVGSIKFVSCVALVVFTSVDIGVRESEGIKYPLVSELGNH